MTRTTRESVFTFCFEKGNVMKRASSLYCLVLSIAALVLTAAQPAAAQSGTVLSHQKISDTAGGFDGTETTLEERARHAHAGTCPDACSDPIGRETEY